MHTVLLRYCHIVTVAHGYCDCLGTEPTGQTQKTLLTLEEIAMVQLHSHTETQRKDEYKI